MELAHACIMLCTVRMYHAYQGFPAQLPQMVLHSHPLASVTATAQSSPLLVGCLLMSHRHQRDGCPVPLPPPGVETVDSWEQWVGKGHR